MWSRGGHDGNPETVPKQEGLGDVEAEVASSHGRRNFPTVSLINSNVYTLQTTEGVRLWYFR